MNKSLFLVLVLTALSTMGYAQTNLDAEVDAELDQMYAAPATTTTTTTQSAQAAKVETVTIPEANSAPAATAPTQTPVQGQPIYILNQATPTATAGANAEAGAGAAAVQKQPTTLIEASPLTESRAEAIRKARQDAEMSTEARIVEKLEQSRLEDEKRRAQALFGDKNLNGEPAPAQAPTAPQPQIIIVPQPVAPTPAPVEPKKEEVKAEPVDAEMNAAVTSEVSMPLEPVAPVAKKYFSGVAGVGEVSGADYVKGNYSLGFTYGTKYDDSYAIEGSFIYSHYEAENIYNVRWPGYDQVDLFDVNQYTGAVALKYYFLKGMVRPLLGGLAQYSYRDFQWSDKNGEMPNLSDSTSHAFDVGAVAGVEIQFSPTMTLGFDLRYIKNIAVNRSYSTSDMRYQGAAPTTGQQEVDRRYGYRTPIEDLDHYVYALSFQVGF